MMSDTSAIDRNQITGLILAGGLGTRMGGVDKGLAMLHGRPLVAHVIARLAPQVATLAINANRSLDRYAALGHPVWPDIEPGFAGPLAGLHSGLTHCRTPYLACAPCDSPLIPADMVARLVQALTSSQADAAIAVTGAGDQHQRHPVCALLKTTTLPGLTAFLAAGERKMGLWFATLNCIDVPFDDAHAFCNINTGLELRQLDADRSEP